MEWWLALILIVVAIIFASGITYLILKLKMTNDEKNSTSKAKKIVEDASLESKKLIEDSRENASRIVEEARDKASNIVEEAKNKADSIKDNAISEGKKQVQEYKIEQEQDIKERKKKF